MNRENFKCILSLICILGGILFSCFSYTLLNPLSPAYIASLILSFGLCIIGTLSFFVHYHNHQIITKLKTNQVPLLAVWCYHPQDFDQVKSQLEDDRYITLSMIFLLGICGLAICLGTFFASEYTNISFGLICILLLVTIFTFSFWSVCRYYDFKLATPHHTIISEDYIYFKSELYSMQKSFYYLEYVELLHLTQHYIQFTYGAPGTPYGPFQIITIPIPKDQLETAYKIQKHFDSRIKESKLNA